MSIDARAGIFAWGSPSFNRLNGEIRRRVVEAAVISDLPGLIFTMGWDLDDPRIASSWTGSARRLRTAGGRVSFVELWADQPTRLARQRSQPRISRKPAKRDLAWDSGIMLEIDAHHRVTSDGDFPYPEDHLRIDTTAGTPAEAAGQIVDGLALSR